MQLSIYDAPGAVEDRITFEITHRTTHETKAVFWVATINGFILADWPTGGELKFRARAGIGVGIAKDWVISKAELGKLKNRIDE